MMSLIFSVLAFSIVIFFREELTRYFYPLLQRHYLMVFLLMLLLSYCGVTLYQQFQSFLIFMVYQITHLKIGMAHIIPFNVSAYFMTYLLHFIIIASLLISYAHYAFKHQSLIDKEQVRLIRQFVYLMFLILMLIFSYEYDLSRYF